MCTLMLRMLSVFFLQEKQITASGAGSGDYQPPFSYRLPLMRPGGVGWEKEKKRDGTRGKLEMSSLELFFFV